MQPLARYINIEFGDFGISADDMLAYMVGVDKHNWVSFFAQTHFKRKSNISEFEYMTAIITDKKITPYIEWNANIFSILILGFILDYYNKWSGDLWDIVDTEIFAYKTNSYGLTQINNAAFKKDGLLYDGKYYIYNNFTNKTVINFTDKLPAFARIIKEQIAAETIQVSAAIYFSMHYSFGQLHAE